jgi:Phage Tail Collar Domain
MSYVLSKSNGSTLLILNDGLVDNAATSITFIGKNVAGYGDAQNQNFLHLLENFASFVEPRSPIQGQLWFDSAQNVFRPAVFDGTNWRPIAVSLYGTSPVDTLVNGSGNSFAANKPGDFWFDSVNKQLYVVNSTASDTTLIGPESVAGFGITKMVSTKMFDASNRPHPVIQITLDGEIVGIMSSATFIPSVANSVPGFTQVNRGMTFKNYNSSTRYTTATSDVVFYGLHEQLDSSYTRRNIDEHIQANWSIDDTKSLKFGTTAQSSIGWNSGLAVTSTGAINLQTSGTTISFSGNQIIPTTGIDLGTSSSVFDSVYAGKLSAGSPTAYGSIEGNWNVVTNSNITPSYDNQASLGSSSKRFGSVWARNLSAGVVTDSATLVGSWQLTTGSSISPVIDLSVALGTTSSRYNAVYTTVISAGTTGTLGIVGTSSLTGDLYPSADSTYDLGSHDHQWHNVNAVNLFSTEVNTNQVDTITVNSTYLNASTATINKASIPTLSIGALIDNFFNTISRFDTDVGLASNSNSNLPTQKAVKTYVDTTATYLKSLIDSAVSGLSTAIANIRTVPAGAVFYIAGPYIPNGYLEANGQGCSASVYPDLFAVINYTYGGSGDLFYLPDLRGQFIRGWDNGRNLDSGRSIGSSQSPLLAAHNHGFPGDDQLAFANGYGGWSERSVASFPYDARSVYGGGAQIWLTTDTGGSETRPTNVALLAVIKT